MPRSAPKKTATAKPAAAKSKRLTPEVRKAQILDAAAKLVVEQGFLPLPLEQLARNAGSSKALIYTYFPTQYALFNALLGREMQSLSLGGLDTASHVSDLNQAAVLCGMLYFEHVARCGPLLHILMTDRFMDGHIDTTLIKTRDTLLQRLIDLGVAALGLPAQEMHAALEMMTAIPEEAGRLVFHNELDLTTARQICNGLIGSSLKALKSPGEVLIPD